MASLFASRRKPRRVGRELDPSGGDDGADSGPVVRRPTTNTTKSKSKLRLSFNPGETESPSSNYQNGATDDSDTSASHGNESRTQTPARSSLLARQAAEKSLLGRLVGPQLTSQSISDQLLPLRGGHLENRPTYNKDYLNELRNSTPTTPKDISAYNSSAEDEDEDEAALKALDVVAKFGNATVDNSDVPSAIPTQAEIRERKERRARLAKEQYSENFISLSDHEDDGEFSQPRRMQVSTFRDRQYDESNTRLVRDDEDIAEGFEDFVEDVGSVALSKKSRAKQLRQEREALRDMIAEAEDSSDEEDSEVEQTYAYESAQTRKGMDGLSSRKGRESRMLKPSAPREITSIPRLGAVLQRLRGEISGLEFQRARLLKAKADLDREKLDIAEREAGIQQVLVEASEKYEMLRREIQGDKEPNSLTGVLDHAGGILREGRGLESLGSTPGP